MQPWHEKCSMIKVAGKVHQIRCSYAALITNTLRQKFSWGINEPNLQTNRTESDTVADACSIRNVF